MACSTTRGPCRSGVKAGGSVWTPMSVRLMQALADSLQARPRPYTLQTAPVDTPLIGHLKTGGPLTPDALFGLQGDLCARRATTSSVPIQAPRPICDGRAPTGYATLTRTTRSMRAVTCATCRRIWGIPASARPPSIRKGMTPDATRPLMRSSRTRCQRAGCSGSCGIRLCALRIKINPAPARLDVKAGFLQNR